MSKEMLQIHSENILPIIKKWLYSDKDIFVRELVSNACDAISKAKVLLERGELASNDNDFRVQIVINKEDKTLKFIDNGIGMDAAEVQKYIAQIAFSGAEEFVNKYKTDSNGEQIIGHFGLGFYSSYMVAAKVEIDTLSYKPGAEAAFWSCDGTAEYTLEQGHRASRGTEITLFIDKENEEYLEDAKIYEILNQYCSFLPYPIYLGDRLINTHDPLWIKPPSECKASDYLEFYRHLYPMEGDPLFWIHLNVDYPFHLKGILYFPKLHRNFDIDKSTVKLYCNRVFVSDNCKDIIPNYLMALRGIIDSPDIPLNVSRSYLQMDRTVRQLSNHISKKVGDSLNNLYRNEHDQFIKCWDDISLVVKLGILEDEKFYERMKDSLIWKNVDGQWTTVSDYLERNRDKTKDKVFYTKDETHASHFLDLYKKKNIEILCADHPIDTHLIHYLERKLTPVTFQRIDAGIDDSIIDKEKEHTILDASGKTEASKLADFIRAKLGSDVSVEAKSLASNSLPGFVMLDENQRRTRDYLQSMDPSNKLMQFPSKFTFVVNTNSPLMTTIQKLDHINPDLAQEMVKETYELALLSHREMDPNVLNDFINRTNHVMEKLAEQALKTSSIPV